MDIEKDEKLIAYCGFYCGACPKYKTGKHNCQGCKGDNPICLNSCKVRPCNIENGYSSCVDCKQYTKLQKCKKYNPFLIKLGEFITGTSRKECVEMIRESGKENFVNYMVEKKLVSIKRNKSKKDN
jgi:hypothetical protein